MSENRQRWTAVIFTLLALVGLVGGYLLKTQVLDRDALWEAQVEQDTEVWMQFLRPDPRLLRAPEDVPEFLEAWQRRQALYDREDAAASLRTNLHAYLDFLESEYADAADIYNSGDDGVLSDGARRNREVLRQRLGELAETLIQQSKDSVREQAYQASPQVVHDVDPLDFGRVYQDVRGWVATAHGIVDKHCVVPTGE